jgi:hypothetical protein
VRQHLRVGAMPAVMRERGRGHETAERGDGAREDAARET